MNNNNKTNPQNKQKSLGNFKHWDPSLKSQLLQQDKRNRTEIKGSELCGESFDYFYCLLSNYIATCV